MRGKAPEGWPVEGALSLDNSGKLCYRPLLGERNESLRGEAPSALPVEGALSPVNCALSQRQTERSEGEGKAPEGWPVEGALSLDNSGKLCYRPLLGERSESLRGEAPSALPVEGALSPINCPLPI